MSNAVQFAISTATIVSGAVAERVKFIAYALYAFFLTAWVYPGELHLIPAPSSIKATSVLIQRSHQRLHCTALHCTLMP